MKIRVGERIKIYNESLLMVSSYNLAHMCANVDCCDCVLCFKGMCIPVSSSEIIFHTNIDMSHKIRKV